MALLDIKLHDEVAYPVADRLREEGIPFAFVTGYDQSYIPRRFADVPYLAKPHAPAVLLPLLAELWSSAQGNA